MDMLLDHIDTALPLSVDWTGTSLVGSQPPRVVRGAVPRYTLKLMDYK